MTSVPTTTVPTTSPLQGQVAWVTGGASGIGAATTEHLADLGARVAALDLNPAVSERPEIVSCTLDVADARQVRDVTASLTDQLGEPDILVLCAGAMGNCALPEFPDETWRRVQSVNLDGSFYVIRAVLAGMIERRRGRIVLISSGAGVRPGPGLAAYATSKAAVIALGKVVAFEGAEAGVTCNIIAPGLVATPMSIGFYGGPEKLHYVATQTHVANVMGVVLEPIDIATAVAFFCLPSSRYITGQTLHVNGGSWMP